MVALAEVVGRLQAWAAEPDPPVRKQPPMHSGPSKTDRRQPYWYGKSSRSYPKGLSPTPRFPATGKNCGDRPQAIRWHAPD